MKSNGFNNLFLVIFVIVTTSLIAGAKVSKAAPTKKFLGYLDDPSSYWSPLDNYWSTTDGAINIDTFETLDLRYLNPRKLKEYFLPPKHKFFRAYGEINFSNTKVPLQLLDRLLEKFGWNLKRLNLNSTNITTNHINSIVKHCPKIEWKNSHITTL